MGAGDKFDLFRPSSLAIHPLTNVHGDDAGQACGDDRGSLADGREDERGPDLRQGS